MAENIKISALNELVSGSVTGTTIIPAVEGGVTLKTQMSSIKAFTNSDVATDTELANSVSTLNNTINALTTDDISEGTNKYYTDARVLAELNSQGVLSGSLPASYTLQVGSVSGVDNISFSGATITDDLNGDVTVTIDASTLAVDDGSTTVSSVETITFSGGATVTAGAAGNVGVAISSGDGLTVIDSSDIPVSVSDVTTINFEGTTIVDEGSGEVTLNIDPVQTPELDTFTGSIDSRVDALELSQIDNDNTFLNSFTGSFSSSVETRVTTLESSGGSSVANGTVSSSIQINNLGFISSSRKFISTTITVTSASIAGDITLEIPAAPPVDDNGGVSFDNNYHIISQSIADGSDTNLLLSNVHIGTGINDFKFLDFSESLDSRFGAGGGGDFINNVSIQNHQIDFAGTGNAFAGLVSLPDGIVSSSSQISELGYANTSDINEAYIKDRLPSGTISGSDQLTDFGFVSNTSTSSFALNDNISGSFTELSESLAGRITTNESATGITEARLGEVTASILNGGARDGEDNPINLVSSSAQIQSSITDEYISASAAASGFGSGGSSDVSSLNIFTGSFSSSIEARIIDIETGGFIEPINNFTGSFSSSVSDRFGSNEARLGIIEVNFDNTALNTFTGSFSSSVASRFDDVEGGGGGADYVSNVELSGNSLNFTGQGSAFNDTVDLSSLANGGETEASFGLISQSYDKSTSNLEIGNVVLGGDSGNTTLSTISQSFDTRINAFAGVTELGGLSDVGDITVDVANGDIFLYDSVEQEFTHSKVLNGDYKITGSVDTKGSMDVSGSITVIGTVTADSFVAGDVGTPTITSATDLDMEATNAVNIDGGGINLTAAGSGMILSSSADITVNHMLTLGKTIGEPSTSPVTGSIMNSGSIDSDSKLWFFNGTEWKEIAFV